MTNEFKVMKRRCNECLYTSKRLICEDDRKEILAEIKEEDRFFVCHKASLRGEVACCRAFFDRQETSPVQLAHRFDQLIGGVIEWVSYD